jgi:hypothetical protein
MRKIVSVGLIGLLTACAVSQVNPLSVPLAYKAPAKPLLPKTLSCPAISRIDVEDRRSEKVLGVRYHESKPLKADVTVASDPAPWVRDGMQTFLERNGVATAPNGARLSVDLGVIRTQENIWVRAGYEAKIGLTARVQSRSGKTCAEQSVEGKSGNYGYAGSIDNYQELLSSTLDDATQHLLDSPQFDTALCQCAN